MDPISTKAIEHFADEGINSHQGFDCDAEFQDVMERMDIQRSDMQLGHVVVSQVEHEIGTCCSWCIFYGHGRCCICGSSWYQGRTQMFRW